MYQDVTITLVDGKPCYNFIVLNKARQLMTITLNKTWDHGESSDLGVLPDRIVNGQCMRTLLSVSPSVRIIIVIQENTRRGSLLRE